jgi:hypothetical protein
MQGRKERQNAQSAKAQIEYSRVIRFAINVAIVVLLAGSSLFAIDPVFCIPPPTNRVPGQPGPPNWLAGLPDTNAPVRTEFDDPRWDGAGSLTWANGTSGDTARFRAIKAGNTLFLSWLVQLSPQSPSNANVVYLGFTQAGGSPTNVGMTINLSTLTPGTDTSDFNPAAFSVDNSGNPTALGSTPPWMNNTRVWITLSNFGVEMAIPISAAGINSGVNISTDFKMWFEMQEALPPATPATVWDAIFPDGRGGTQTATDVVSSGFATVFPAPSTWASVHFSTGPGDAACTLGGISITESQIGTTNPVQSQILFKQTGVNNLVNHFFASPTNGMTTDIPPGGITATFRIADWGSTFDPNAPFTTIPGGQDVPSTAAITHGTTASNNNITFDWTVQDVPGKAWLTEFRGGREPDQCMLVELAGGTLKTWQGGHAYLAGQSIVDPLGNLQTVTVPGTSGGLQPTFNATSGGTTLDPVGVGPLTWTNSGPAIGPGLTFLNNSVLTNMDFVGVSAFQRKAAINIQNLPPLSPTPRDVYLYVQTQNMPSAVEKGWVALYNRLFGPPASRSPEKTRAVINQMSLEARDQTLASYRVFVFHDSGKKITINSKDFVIVHPQSGFGYYALPHTDVTGWVHSLEGATEIAPDLYRIAIANNGVATVVTKFEALEPGQVPPPGPHNFAIFADLGAAIPNGTFSNVVNTGFSFNGGLEYIVNSHISAEGIFGVHHFPGKIAGDVTAIQFTGGGKVYLTNSPNRVFARAGLGGYHFTSGTTNFGGYFGAGLLHEFNAHFGLEGVYTFHAVNTPGTATKFSTVQGGVRYAF